MCRITTKAMNMTDITSTVVGPLKVERVFRLQTCRGEEQPLSHLKARGIIGVKMQDTGFGRTSGTSVTLGLVAFVSAGTCTVKQ